jgi:glutaredoxin
MKIRMLLSIAVIFIAIQGFSFAAANSGTDAVILLAAQDAPKVELYITDWCPYCRHAVKFFESRGIPYTVYDIEKDKEAARRKNELDNRRGVPFAVINGKRIHGYSAEMYQRALDGK